MIWDPEVLICLDFVIVFSPILEISFLDVLGGCGGILVDLAERLAIAQVSYPDAGDFVELVEVDPDGTPAAVLVH